MKNQHVPFRDQGKNMLILHFSKVELIENGKWLMEQPANSD